jgi:hypothetical protein
MISRRGLIALGAAVAGCAGPDEQPRPVMRPFDYSHLTVIRLDVAQVEVVDQWVPPRTPPNVDHRAPVEPREALRRMLTDRVQAWGRQGRARAIIEEASLIEERLPRQTGLGALFSTQPSERYVLTLTARLEVEGPEGRRGSAQATVTRTRTVLEGTSLAAREAVWYEMLRSAMDDPQGMNVEFEFQVRRALRGFIVPEGTPRPPPGGAIETQELAPPSSAVAPARTGTLGTLPAR